jgi:hypothetical protein
MSRSAIHLLPTLIAVREALSQGLTDLEHLGARISKDQTLIQVLDKGEWASFHASDLETIIRNLEASAYKKEGQ